jgi:hypothetical protein
MTLAQRIRQMEYQDDAYWEKRRIEDLRARLKAEPVPSVTQKKTVNLYQRPAWYQDFVFVGRPRGCDRLDLPANK